MKSNVGVFYFVFLLNFIMVAVICQCKIFLVFSTKFPKSLLYHTYLPANLNKNDDYFAKF